MLSISKHANNSLLQAKIQDKVLHTPAPQKIKKIVKESLAIKHLEGNNLGIYF